MPRANRVFSSNSVYEIVPRAQEHLPMPPTATTNEIRLGILGRTQRDNKVELCHFVDTNNHSIALEHPTFLSNFLSAVSINLSMPRENRVYSSNSVYEIVPGAHHRWYAPTLSHRSFERPGMEPWPITTLKCLAKTLCTLVSADHVSLDSE